MKVDFYLDVGELTSRMLAKRLRMLANELLAKRPDTPEHLPYSLGYWLMEAGNQRDISHFAVLIVEAIAHAK